MDRDALLLDFDRRDGGSGSLPGDADLSGMNDAADLNAIALSWQSDADSFSRGDFNGSRFVDAADLNELAIYWQKTAADFAGANSVAVPEPHSAMLTLTTILAVLATVRLSRQHGSSPG